MGAKGVKGAGQLDVKDQRSMQMVLYYLVVDVNDWRSNGTGKGVRQMEARMMELQRRRREKIPCIRSLFQLDSAARAEQDGAIWVLSRAEQTSKGAAGRVCWKGGRGGIARIYIR